MTGRFVKTLTISVFIITILGIGFLILFPNAWDPPSNTVIPQSRIIVPQELMHELIEASLTEHHIWAEQMIPKIPLEDGEILITLLNHDFNGNLHEDQIIAYRNLLEGENTIYLTLIEYDPVIREYRRIWNASTAATRPGTVSLYTQDLIGDRGICILLFGMNGLGENTLTIFRGIDPEEPGPPFNKIAEIRIDGSIIIREVERSQAYQLGLVRGQSHSVIAYGRDWGSSNIMDQVEISYNYSEEERRYTQTQITSIPGARIEQDRVQNLLGNINNFEEFINGLWYYISPQGTIDNRQFIYFDPSNKEIIFYDAETQQIYNWENSNASRLGLQIRCQNTSVSNMRRTINIELESLDSIRIRIEEDIRIRIGVAAPWDGSYRKAVPQVQVSQISPSINAHISAVYDGTMGRLRLFPDGSFELTTGGTIRQGNYAFFFLDDQELLELRSIENQVNREIYLVESIETEPENSSPRRIIGLSRIRLGARGIQRLHEGTIILNLTAEY